MAESWLNAYVTPDDEHVINLYIRTGSLKQVGEALATLGRKEGARKFLARRPVQARIKSIIAKNQSEHIELTKHGLLSELKVILAEGKPFERIKAIELIGKFEGLFAPSRSITEHHVLGVSPYASLLQTLQAGTKFTIDERAQIRQQLLTDREAMEEALQLLEGAILALPSGRVEN